MGREKRLVLVIDPDLNAMSVYVFAVLTHGYRAIGVNTSEQAKQAVQNHPIDAIFFMSGRVCNFVGELGLPFASGKSMQEALMALKLAVVRKRGPKPGTPMQPSLKEQQAVLAHA